MKKLSTKILVAAITAVAIASPAFAHSGLRHDLTSSRQSGSHAYAMVLADATYSPTLAGGGSAGYNENLRQDRW